MKNLNALIFKTKNNPWAMLVIRLLRGVLLVILVHWYPRLFTWYSHTILREEFKYDENGHLLAIYFAYIFLLIIIVSNIIIGVRLWRERNAS